MLCIFSCKCLPQEPAVVAASGRTALEAGLLCRAATTRKEEEGSNKELEGRRIFPFFFSFPFSSVHSSSAETVLRRRRGREGRDERRLRTGFSSHCVPEPRANHWLLPQELISSTVYSKMERWGRMCADVYVPDPHRRGQVWEVIPRRI